MEEKLSPQQSLQLIQSMIDRTKTNIGENRFYFLMWGWLILGAVLLQFFLKVVVNYEYHYIVWLVTIIGMILTIMRGKSDARKQAHRTYIGDSMGYLWMGIGIGFFVMSVIISISIGWLKAWPLFIMFYGMGTFISGKLIKFQPLVIGGVICWVLAPVAAVLHYDYQLLLGALAILCSYIIPGYLINSDKKLNNQ